MKLENFFATSETRGQIMASLINGYDWKNHPLGEISTWPHALTNIVDTMLASHFPMNIAWGEEGYYIYNDGYIPIQADKHPHALGSTLNQVWGEISPELKVLITKARNGESSYFEDLRVPLLKNGKLEDAYFTFSCCGVRGDAGNIEGFYTVCLDTTASFLAKQTHISENERLRSMFEQAPGFMALLRGPTHIYEVANDAALALMGDRGNIIGKSVAEAIPEAAEQGFLGLLDQVYQTGEPFVGRDIRLAVARVPGKPPVEIYMDFVYQPIFDARQQITGIMAQGHEITDAHFAREALMAGDRQKDQFIATLAHELRNPLAPIRTAAHLLELPNVTPERRDKACGVISRQVEHMSKLLDDLLDVARIARNQVRLANECVSVETIVAAAIETARPLIEKKEQKIIVRQHGLIQLDGDPVRLTQVLSNLICNAAKYTDCGGELIVSTRRDGDQCQISVADNGIGISQEALGTIFTMFSQEVDVIDRSEGGLGMGLGIVKGLVALHGGSVYAESKGRGEGCTFTVVLPCSLRKDALGGTAPPKSGLLRMAALKILLADDNTDLVNTLTELMEMLGHKVVTAGNGHDALTRARKERPDVAVLDIGMPGMNGYEVAKAIRTEEWGRTITLIAATGWGTAEDQEKAKSAGFDFHLAKPFAIDKLQTMLQQVNKG